MEEETAMAGTAIVFLNGPYSEKTGEGIDMLLAASAFDEEITAIFMGEGVKNLTEPREKSSSLPDLSADSGCLSFMTSEIFMPLKKTSDYTELIRQNSSYKQKLYQMMY